MYAYIEISIEVIWRLEFKIPIQTKRDTDLLPSSRDVVAGSREMGMLGIIDAWLQRKGTVVELFKHIYWLPHFLLLCQQMMERFCRESILLLNRNLAPFILFFQRSFDKK